MLLSQPTVLCTAYCQQMIRETERWSEIPLITVVWKEKQLETTTFHQGEISISYKMSDN